jgi:hypothetical protein
MYSSKRELYTDVNQLKLQEDERYEEYKRAVVRLFIKKGQADLLPMLGLSEDDGQHLPAVS